MAFVKVGNRKFNLPGSPHLRMVLGSLLVAGGVLGFLPILGFWMIPVGLVVLSVDSPGLRRSRRRMEVWWGRRKRAKDK